ncbi:MAG: hypothetical protein Ct9H300mP31_21090 [Acidimicrobiaceae bacterium]|nr:MAG: hypothetical protein Ct9H300mP31_21090 [Acidimicrobiaceae bacterium]
MAALSDVGAVGGSIYDWATTGTQARRLLADLMADFPEASAGR